MQPAARSDSIGRAGVQVFQLATCGHGIGPRHGEVQRARLHIWRSRVASETRGATVCMTCVVSTFERDVVDEGDE